MYTCIYIIIITYTSLNAYYICIWLYPLAKIIKPPESTTICNGSDVTISCGYQSSVLLPIVWRIDDVIYFSDDLVDNDPRYHLNNKSNPEGYSLTIYSVNYTTTVWCGICSPTRYSTYGMVTIGMYLTWFILYIHVFTSIFHPCVGVSSHQLFVVCYPMYIYPCTHNCVTTMARWYLKQYIIAKCHGITIYISCYFYFFKPIMHNRVYVILVDTFIDSHRLYEVYFKTFYDQLQSLLYWWTQCLISSSAYRLVYQFRLASQLHTLGQNGTNLLIWCLSWEVIQVK